MRTPEELIEAVKQGDRAAMARAISLIESGHEGIENVVAELHAAGGRAHVVGLTGPAGSGKSTLVASLAKKLRERDERVGIIAVDPSSSLTGGSILGDRVRGGEALSDTDIFFRSMATRGALGGLARATADSVTVLEAGGAEWVLVETVGAGQAEVDIASASHTTVVVSVPGLGDEIQTIKAGLLEIADIHVVNKSDLRGANKAVGDLKSMLKMNPEAERRPPVIPVSAVTGDGIDKVVAALDEHRAWLSDSGELESKEKSMIESRIRFIVNDLVLQRVEGGPTNGMDALVDSVRRRELDPFNAARKLVEDRL